MNDKINYFPFCSLSKQIKLKSYMERKLLQRNFLHFYGVYEEMQAREAFKGQPKSALKKEFSYKESFYTDIQVVHYILWEK